MRIDMRQIEQQPNEDGWRVALAAAAAEKKERQTKKAADIE